MRLWLDARLRYCVSLSECFPQRVPSVDAGSTRKELQHRLPGRHDAPKDLAGEAHVLITWASRGAAVIEIGPPLALDDVVELLQKVIVLVIA